MLSHSYRIDDNFVLKVSDFGLTEDIYAKHYYRQGIVKGEDGAANLKLPVRWMAIESLHDGVFTEKTDVVSFNDVVSIYKMHSYNNVL